MHPALLMTSAPARQALLKTVTHVRVHRRRNVFGQGEGGGGALVFVNGSMKFSRERLFSIVDPFRLYLPIFVNTPDSGHYISLRPRIFETFHINVIVSSIYQIR